MGVSHFAHSFLVEVGMSVGIETSLEKVHLINLQKLLILSQYNSIIRFRI